jgi:hypothetical protein
VADDGHGFAPELPSGGLGLASMRERAAAAGGALTVRSGPAGTQVRMTVPIKPSPVKPSPVKPSPVKPSPVKPGPVKPGSVKAGPIKAGPVRASPVKPGHVKAGGER